MATDAISLNNQGLMYAGQSPPQWQLMKLSLLSQILTALNPMAATDPNSLLTAAQNYCTFGPQAWQLMELALLAQIAGAMPASIGIFSGTGAPGFTPVVQNAIYIQTDSAPPGLIWQYYNGSWH